MKNRSEKGKSSSNINPKLTTKRRSSLSQTEIDKLLQKVKQGDRFALSKAITFIESQKPEDQNIARMILDKIVGEKTKTKRIAISGAPGAGKSSFLEAIGTHLIDIGYRIAILAVDPSSTISKGSILADKTRMAELSKNSNAFIRPTASASYLGGVAKSTHETIQLCEAAGFDIIFVETVGVGQSETSVANMVDFFILLIQPGAGDSLQGIKRGIMELADLIVINKADGERVQLAENTKIDYAHSLKLILPKVNFWETEIALCSSVHKTGIGEIWELIEHWYSKANASWLKDFRTNQNIIWFEQILIDHIKNHFYEQEKFRNEIEKLKSELEANKISVASALFHASKNLNL